MATNKLFQTNPKSLAIFLLKLGLTAAAIYFIGRKVEWTQVLERLKSLHTFWFLLAWALFIAAKWISTYRLKSLFKSIGFDIDQGFNLRVFFIGSFFNLFLPSSVGGDGVKAMLIVEETGCKKRSALGAVFLDRLSGMAALVAWTFLLLIIADPVIEPNWLAVLFWPGLILAMPVYIGIQQFIFKPYASSRFQVAGISVLVQFLHILSAWALFKSLGGIDRLPDYLAVFMASVSASVVPITIGGLGIRELVSGYLGDALQLDHELAVSLAFSYFIVIVLSSLPGLPLMLLNLKRQNT